ncbi:MAG: hypothetical protein K1W39_14880 [Lachnospiraceae bacterium]|jgi:hypothetical protein
MRKKTFISMVFGLVTGIGTGIVIAGKVITKPKLGGDKKTEKFKQYYYMMNEWLRLKQEGKTLEKYFLDNNYKSIAIYGMGEVGNRLYYELKDSNINIEYAIDKNAGFISDDLEIKDIDDDLTGVDAIIVTATFAFDEIIKDIEDKVSFPIISLEDVIYEIE